MASVRGAFIRPSSTQAHRASRPLPPVLASACGVAFSGMGTSRSAAFAGRQGILPSKNGSPSSRFQSPATSDPHENALPNTIFSSSLRASSTLPVFVRHAAMAYALWLTMLPWHVPHQLPGFQARHHFSASAQFSFFM